MNCADAAERITALVDGELPAAEARLLEEHLASCAACREARAAEEGIAARLRAAPRPALPAGFARGVMDRVAAAPAPGAPLPDREPGRILRLFPLWVAAGAVAAAVVAMVMIGPGETGHFAAPKATVASGSGAPPPAAEARVGDGSDGRVRSGGAPTRANEDAAPPAAPALPAPGGSDAEEESGLAARAAPGPAAPVPAPPAGLKKPSGEVETTPGPQPAKVGLVDAADDRKQAPAGDPSPAGAAVPAAAAPAAPGAPPEPAGAAPGKGKDSPAAEDGAWAKGEERKGDKGERTKAAAAEIPRVALYYAVGEVGRGQQEVERAIRTLGEAAAAGRGTWREAAETKAKEAPRALPGDARGGGGADAPAGPEVRGGRILEIRMKAADVDRLRTLLGKTGLLREGGLQLLTVGKPGEPAPRPLPGVGTPESPDLGGRGMDSGGRADRGLTGGATEPVPPPAPTADQLRRMAEALPPSRESGASLLGVVPSGTEEVVLEIHILREGASDGK